MSMRQSLQQWVRSQGGQRYLATTAIALAVILIVLALEQFGGTFYQELEAKTLDLRFRLRPPRPQHPDIVLIDIDQRAIDDLGRWPWPRRHWARIVSTLAERGASQVLFDVLFTDPQQLLVDRGQLEDGLGWPEAESQISLFLDEVISGIDRQEISWSQAKDSLEQVKSGLVTVGASLQSRLQDVALDDDQLFADAVGRAGSIFLGNRMKVLVGEEDEARWRAARAAGAQLSAAVEERRDRDVVDLPLEPPAGNALSRQEWGQLLMRARIRHLLLKDLAATSESIAAALSVNDPVSIRGDYFAVKSEMIDEAIERIGLDGAPTVQQVAWALGVMDAETIRLIGERVEWHQRLDLFRERVGRAVGAGAEAFYLAVEADPPLLPYLQQLRGSGFLNAIPDSDGVVRRVPLFARYGDRLYPQIAVSALLDRLGVAAEGVRVVPGEVVVFEGSPTSGQGGAPLYAVPIDHHGQMLVNWAGPWEETFTHLSCSDVYRLWQLRDNVDHNRQLPSEELEAVGLLEQLQADERRLEATERELARQVSGKICIIGLTAPGTHDYNPIPLESNYPLVGTHANVLNTILQQDYIHRIGRGVDAAVLVACVLFVALLLPRCSAVRGLVLSAVGMAGFTAAACALFSRWNIWIGMMSPWLGMSLTYVGTVTYRYMTEEREKRWIRSAFSRYISANVMEEVLSDPSRLRLGGERRELTVLFSDIRSFTTFSEQREPEEVVAMLNEYLDAMTKIVFKHNGTLDKYVGDEIMAVYGAPSAQPQTDHALRAVKTALEMMEVLHDLQVKWQGEGKPPLDIGIGLNTGVMVVGNMGSTERMDYTVIGDAVNLGARVEALTRQYNNHIIITEFTYEHVREAVEVKELGSVTVKGKNRPVLIYELLGLKEGQPVVSA